MRALIEVHGLRLTYPGAERSAVDGIDFEVRAGETFGFLGPNGAGKSTTQRVLIGLLREYEGVVRVAGREPRDWGDELYERIGVQFEFPNHYLKLTGRENLEYFRALYSGATEAPAELLDRLELDDAADRRVATYSKGMRVRLGLARALLNRPEILFLDEPTGGLDPVSSRQVRELIRSQRERGTSVFLTTHDMVLADSVCDRVAFIVDGRLALVDRPAALRRGRGVPTVELELGRDGQSRIEEFPLDGIGENDGFLQALRSGRVRSIRTRETTLEEVFVDVTGRRLR